MASATLYSPSYSTARRGGLRGAGGISTGLLLDSRVVDLPMTYDLTFDMLLSLKPLFFNSLKISHDSQTTLKHKPLESNKSERRYHRTPHRMISPVK